MGKKLFYIIAGGFSILSALGIFQNSLSGKLMYIFAAALLIYFSLYALRRKVEIVHTIIAYIMLNLSVQLTGGIRSPLFVLYYLALPITGYKEQIKNYWICSGTIFIIEIISGVLKRNFGVIPMAAFAAAIIAVGVVIQKIFDREQGLKKALIKYETRDQFFSPVDFESEAVITSVKDIDRHPGIERPLLYYIKFVHNMFNANSTVIFSYSDNNLVLVQGFSRSELFRPNAVLETKAGLYRQVLAEKKSVLIREFVQDPAELGFYKGELKIASVLIAPIIILDQIEGIFVVDRKENEFTDEEKEKFDDAAKCVGFLLAMLRLYEKERYDARYLSTIAKLAHKLQRGLELKSILADTVEAFRGVLKCDDISIAKIDELNNQGIVLQSTYIKENTKFSLDDGLVGLISKHKNTILKEDLSHGDLVVMKKGEKKNRGSFVGVPVKENDDIIGIIWLEDHRKKRFGEDDMRALNILASQLTLAWQRANLHEKVKERSERDGLTGLYNHRHFQEVLEDEVARNKEFILVFFDIDYFKKINDTYGHQAGDEVLKFLGRLISQTGIAGRYGGEEFAIIFPGHSLKKGVEIAVHLKDHINKSEVKFNQLKIKFTISVGIAHFPKDAKTRTDLIEMADRALYSAKETGRDKIVIAKSLFKKNQNQGCHK